MRRLLITGAGGLVGGMLRDGLHGVADEVRLADIRPLTANDGETVLEGDVADLAFTRQAIAGCDACIHLAAISVEAPFEQILHANIKGTWAVFEAARLEGCARIVFASSNHVTGFYSTTNRIGPDSPVRPDTFYGASKVFGEAMGSLYHDKFGLRVACVRIGTALARPRELRHLATWLSPGDLIRLMTACLTAPELGFEIVYGVSANRRRYWDLEAGRKLGFEPVDDAEVFAADVAPVPAGDFQGGTKFTAQGSTP